MIEAISKEKDIFIDTSAFVAMRVTDDHHYDRAQEFLSIVKKQRLHLMNTSGNTVHLNYSLKENEKVKMEVRK